MEDGFCGLDGTPSSPATLSIPKARDLAVRLEAGDIEHASLIECLRRPDCTETVIFDVQVEVPQVRVHPVRRRERIAATFTPRDDRLPKIEALRRDFPVVPHLNLHVQGFPRDLCLYDEKYDELRRRLTAPRLVSRVREWLAFTARGELHQADQYLEPLLVDYDGRIVLPSDLPTDAPERLYLTGSISEDLKQVFLIAHRHPPTNGTQHPKVLASVYRCEPRTHGVIHRRPATLADVADIAKAGGLDLIGDLRRRLPTWKDKHLDYRLVLTLLFPTARAEGGAVEECHLWCFLIPNTVSEMGIAVGIWSMHDKQLATIVGGDESKRGQDIEVSVMNPCFALTRDLAAQMNAAPEADDRKFVAVGAGALGSQIVLNAARAGFGHWTIIDPDMLMPHNTARHALDGRFVGVGKADGVAFAANTLTYGPDVFQAIQADIIRPGDLQGAIDVALSSADVIMDMSASIAAQRHVARGITARSRRASMFLTPSGSDLVMLAEDPARATPLDALEMQYYRAVVNVPELAGHIDIPDGRIRYARSCGDRSSTIPQDLVGLHAAIASRVLKDVLASREPSIGIWRAGTDGTVAKVEVAVRNVAEFVVGGWIVVLDDGLRERLALHREKKLPNETGGILLGSFDLERQILYLVDTLPSPPDSQEKPDLYIRGCTGLGAQVEAIHARTGGILEYVGEWHSHPRGAGTSPSGYDLEAFDWLTELMAKDGLPAVMMIAGDHEYSLFVGVMGRDAAPIPGSPL